MSEWDDYDFIVGERAEIARPIAERTGWETVRFDLADEEVPTPET